MTSTNAKYYLESYAKEGNVWNSNHIETEDSKYRKNRHNEREVAMDLRRSLNRLRGWAEHSYSPRATHTNVFNNIHTCTRNNKIDHEFTVKSKALA